MILSRIGRALTALVVVGVVAAGSPSGPRSAGAQHGHGGHGGHGGSAPASGDAKAGVRIDMETLHRAGGVPPGWRFSWPAGDPKKGREAYVKLECYQCHEVQGESFPPVTHDPKRRGPGLTGMGRHHPAEYFAESILSPNAVIVTGPGHTGDDGLSIMPDYRDSLTLAEAIDLVAYIRSLTTGGHHGGHHAEASAPREREKVVGDYRIRVTLGGGSGHHGHGQSHHGSQPQHGATSHMDKPQHHAQPRHGSPQPAATTHLMVFVADGARGEPVPYLPVSATLHGAKTPPRTVTLTPMIGAQGFHYGADVTPPAGLAKITVTIGKPMPSLRLAPSESARFGKAVEASFDWGN